MGREGLLSFCRIQTNGVLTAALSINRGWLQAEEAGLISLLDFCFSSRLSDPPPMPLWTRKKRTGKADKVEGGVVEKQQSVYSLFGGKGM